MRGNRFEWKKGALCHGPEDLVHDPRSPPIYPKAEVMLSNNFRCFGREGTAKYKSRYPEVKRAVEPPGRGHRVHHDEPLRIDFQTLMNQDWRKNDVEGIG